MRPVAQEMDHRSVADLRIINQQLFLRAFNEMRKLLSRVNRTDHEALQSWLVRLASNIGVEQSRGFLQNLGIVDDKSETAAVLDIEVCVIERQQIQYAKIDDHELVMM